MTIVFREQNLKAVMIPEDLPWCLSVEKAEENFAREQEESTLELVLTYGTHRHILSDSISVQANEFCKIGLAEVEELFETIIQEAAAQTVEMDHRQYLNLSNVIETQKDSFHDYWRKAFPPASDFDMDEELKNMVTERGIEDLGRIDVSIQECFAAYKKKGHKTSSPKEGDDSL